MSETAKVYDRAKGKRGHKSLRIRERVQFAVEFWAQFDNKSDTAFIEIACEAMADALAKENGISWRKLFHPHEGVRALRIFLMADYPLSDEEERLRSFVLTNREFFYSTVGSDLLVIVPNVEVLWPNIRDFSSMKEESDYWAPAKAMSAALSARGIDPPKHDQG